MPDTEIAYIALSPSTARWEEKGKGEALNRMVLEYTRQIPGLRTSKRIPFLWGQTENRGLSCSWPTNFISAQKDTGY